MTRLTGRAAQLGLALYFIAMIAISAVHNLFILGALLAVAGLLAGRRILPIARRALLALLLFNSVISVAYVGMALMQGNFAPRYLAMINLRVFLLTFLTFLFHARVNPLAALSFSKSLLHLLTIAYGQALVFRKLFADFRLALESRAARRPRLCDLYRSGAAAMVFFFSKSLRNATEVTQAMISRGGHHD